MIHDVMALYLKPTKLDHGGFLIVQLKLKIFKNLTSIRKG